jgi:hypothetical protein
MMDAADLPDIEERYQQPVYRKVLEILGPDITETEEFQLITVLFAWCLSGFTNGGAPLRDGTHLDPAEPQDRNLFRTYMTILLERVRTYI